MQQGGVIGIDKQSMREGGMLWQKEVATCALNSPPRQVRRETHVSCVGSAQAAAHASAKCVPRLYCAGLLHEGGDIPGKILVEQRSELSVISNVEKVSASKSVPSFAVLRSCVWVQTQVISLFLENQLELNLLRCCQQVSKTEI